MAEQDGASKNEGSCKIFCDMAKKGCKDAAGAPFQLFILIVKLTPIVNYLYSVFFTPHTPEVEDIIDMTNSNLLVAALMFTVVVAIPLSIAKEELDWGDFDYSLHGKYGCMPYANEDVYSDHHVSMTLCLYSFRAILSTLASILLAFITLLSISSLPPTKQDDASQVEDEFNLTLKERETREELDKNNATLKLWWFYAGRWILCFSSLTLIIGMGYTVTATQYIIEVRWFNEYRANRCLEVGWQFNGTDDRTGADYYTIPDPWDYEKDIEKYSIADEVMDSVFSDGDESPVGIAIFGVGLMMTLVTLTAVLSGYLLVIGEWGLGARCYPDKKGDDSEEEGGQVLSFKDKRIQQLEKNVGLLSTQLRLLTRPSPP